MRLTKHVAIATGVGLVATATFVAGIFVARAKPGGESRRSLSFSGRLSGTTGPQSLTFVFKKAGTTQCEPKVSASPDATGAFKVEIPLAACPLALFDGDDVTFDVTVGTAVVARDQVVNPVPYALYANQLGSSDCPVGYSRDASIAAFVVCGRANDEVVKVGTGAAAFWIDRYEASVWSSRDGAAPQFGVTGADYPASFPANGQYTAPLFALSRLGATPSRNLTWFQAAEACAASGKRLPRSAEWLLAARGTSDPSADSDGTGGACVTKAASPRKVGDGTACVSAWGAQDMVGNSWEWVEEWHAALGAADVGASPWPTGFGSDATYNIVSRAITASGAAVGAPAALARGGSIGEGVNGGLHSMLLSYSPAMQLGAIGFRCLTPR